MKNTTEISQFSYFSTALTNLSTLIVYPIKHPIHALAFLILTNQVLETTATLPITPNHKKQELQLSPELGEHLQQISTNAGLLQASFLEATARGDYKTANENLDDLLEIYGEEEILVEAKAKTTGLLGDLATATEWTEKLYEINNENEYALATLIKKESLKKDNEKIKNYGKQIEKIKITTAEGYFARSVARVMRAESPFDRELFKKSIDDLKEAEKLVPGLYYAILQQAEQRAEFLEKGIPRSIGLTNDIAQVNYVIPLSPQTAAAFHKDVRANFGYRELNKAVDEKCGLIFAANTDFVASIKDRTAPALNPGQSFIFLHKYAQYYLYIAHTPVKHELQVTRTDVIYSRSEIKNHFLEANTVAILTPEGFIFTEAQELSDYLKYKQNKSDAEDSSWFNRSTITIGLLTLGALIGIPYFIRRRKDFIKKQDLARLMAEEEKNELQQKINNNKSILLTCLNTYGQRFTKQNWLFQNDIFSLDTNPLTLTLNVQENLSVKGYQLTEITLDKDSFRKTLQEKMQECFGEENVVMINNVLNIQHNLLEKPDKTKIIRAFDNAVTSAITDSFEYTSCSKYHDMKKNIEEILKNANNKHIELISYIEAVKAKAIKAKKENPAYVDKADEFIFACNNIVMPELRKDAINTKLDETKKYINQLKKKAAIAELQQCLTENFNHHENDKEALEQYLQDIIDLSDTLYAKEKELDKLIKKVESTTKTEDDFAPGPSKPKKDTEKTPKPKETPEEKAIRLKNLADKKEKRNVEQRKEEEEQKKKQEKKTKSSSPTLYGFIPNEQRKRKVEFNALLRDQALRIENRVTQIEKKEIDIDSELDNLIATRALLYNFLRISEALREKMYWHTAKSMDVLRNGIMKNVFLPKLSALLMVANEFIENKWVNKILEHLDTGKELSIDEWIDFLKSSPLYHHYEKEFPLESAIELLDLDTCMQFIFKSMYDLRNTLKVIEHEADLEKQPDRNDAANHCVMTIGHCAEQLAEKFPQQYAELRQHEIIAEVFNISMPARRKIGHAPSPKMRTYTWNVKNCSEDFIKHPAFKIYYTQFKEGKKIQKSVEIQLLNSINTLNDKNVKETLFNTLMFDQSLADIKEFRNYSIRLRTALKNVCGKVESEDKVRMKEILTYLFTNKLEITDDQGIDYCQFQFDANGFEEIINQIKTGNYLNEETSALIKPL